MTDTMTPPEEPMTPPAAEAGPTDGPPPAGEPTVGAVPQIAASAPADLPEGDSPGISGGDSPAIDPIPTRPTEHEKGPAGEIRKIADDYVIPISDEATKEWAKVSKDGSHAEFVEYAKQVASGLYPTLAPQIAMGLPTRILLDPYIELAEKLLGPLPEEPDWTDPKWMAALQGGTDPKTGRAIPMTMTQWQDHIGTDPGHGWDQSPKANQRAMDFIQELDKSFNSRPQG